MFRGGDLIQGTKKEPPDVGAALFYFAALAIIKIGKSKIKIIYIGSPPHGLTHCQ